MGDLIEVRRSIVLAADVPPEKFGVLASQMADVDGLSGIKIGFELGLGLGLANATAMVKDADPTLEVIYDHQKAGNDIPATGANFARAMVRGNVDTAILFPYTGPVTQNDWTVALQAEGIKVISGGEMTHEQIASSQDGASLGYVHPSAFKRMYANAMDLGVTDFVVPGNKPDRVAEYKAMFDEELGEGHYTLWAPGFVDQGGDVSETGKVAGPRFNAIVGGGIYKAADPHQAAVDLGQKALAI